MQPQQQAIQTTTTNNHHYVVVELGGYWRERHRRWTHRRWTHLERVLGNKDTARQKGVHGV
jgi:hypothetical protein